VDRLSRELHSQYLTTTTSTCRHCGRLVSARVHIEEDGVWFHKQCPEHGPQSARVYADAEQYVRLNAYHRVASCPIEFTTASDRGCPESCGLCPEHEQHVCMPMVEITDHCDLACPICLVKNRSSFHLTRGQVAIMLDRLIATEGQTDVVNLSGGEPTMNPEFRGIVDECLSRKEIVRLSVSTNGLRLVQEPDLLAFLAERNVVISLQFDGLREEPHVQLRGRPLLQDKLRLIEQAGALDASMSLTVTVARGINDADVAEVPRLLFEHDHILSVMFQPAAYIGRAAGLPRPSDAVTIPDIIRLLGGAADGRVAASDFSPLPCSHPACFSLAFYLRVAGDLFLPIKRMLEVDRYLDIIKNRAIFGTDADSFESIKDAVYDLWSGPAALAPDSEKALAAVKRIINEVAGGGCYCASRAVAAAERSVKSIFIHHFMDRDTFDLARARKCCNVYPLADGRMMPACVYNCLRR
jgi:7,8-dihydro-6-hydroxymethylpterin dimethyltransferase